MSEILYAKYGNSDYIFESFEGKLGYKHYITNGSYYNYSKNPGMTYNWKGYIVIKATPEQILWLQECIFANKFVKEPVIQGSTNYEIY